MTYAQGTSVSVEKSRAELDRLLSKAGATQRMMGSDDVAGAAFVVFTLDGRQVRLRIPLPKLTDRKIERDGRGTRRNAEGQRKALEQASRERWRQLLLLVKAKLEAIALGLSTVEREFLADIYLVDGRTVHQALVEDLDRMYRDGAMPKLLGSGGP